MKIKRCETYVLGTPWRNLTYLFIELADGTRGVGEARVLGKTHTVLEFLKDTQHHFIGHNVYDIEDLYRRFTLLDFGVPGEVVMTGPRARGNGVLGLHRQIDLSARVQSDRRQDRIPRARVRQWLVHCGAHARGICPCNAQGGGPRLQSA